MELVSIHHKKIVEKHQYVKDLDQIHGIEIIHQMVNVPNIIDVYIQNFVMEIQIGKDMIE